MTSWRCRTARLDEAAAIEALQVRCVTAQEGGFYTTHQIRSFIREVGTLDLGLIADGTYYVVEDGGALIGCGGWSRRAPHYDGSRDSNATREVTPHIRAMFVDPRRERQGVGRAIMAHIEGAIADAGHDVVTLTAMLSGVAFYHALDYRKTADGRVTLPNGVSLLSIEMLKRLDTATHPLKSVNGV